MSDAVLTASRLLMTVSASSIAAVDESITIPQFRVLVLLQSRGPMRLARLADVLDVHLSTVTRAVDRMISTGLLRRTPHDGSRRQAVLELTERGNDVCTQVTLRRRARIDEIVCRIPEDRRAQLAAAAEAFTEAGGEPPVILG